MGEEEEKRPAEIEYQVLNRTIITTYPRVREAALTSLVTYSAPDLPPRSISILLNELEPERFEEMAEQIKAKAGPLWDRYLEEEKRRIADDIRARLAFKPEVWRVKL